MGETKVWTGERLETFIFNANTVEHLHRYAITIDYVKDKIVLDIASGEGYGSNLLSKYAKNVFGVDIDEASIEAAKAKYKSENLAFKLGQADLIPLGENSVDVVISFETLEHHDKHEEMMKEIKRVLRADGIVIISTPVKRYFSGENKSKNPFHLKELNSHEFKELINRHFTNTQFYFQNMFKGSLIISEENGCGFKCLGGDFDSININNEFMPLYQIAIAGDIILPNSINMSVFDGQSILNKEHEEFVSRISKEMEVAKEKTREDAVNWMRNSMPYRLGNAILSPFKIFKK